MATFREIRKAKGLTTNFVLDKLKEQGIELTNWQLNTRETNPKRFEPREIQALCSIYEVEINEVQF